MRVRLLQLVVLVDPALTLIRALRGEYAGVRHSSSHDVYRYKDDGALQWSEEHQAWLQPEGEGAVLRVGHCGIRRVRVTVTGRDDAEGQLRGLLRYEAKTVAAWNGAYAHFWLQWRRGDVVVCSMDTNEEQGLIPHDVMFKLLYPNSPWRTFESHFAIDLGHQRADHMRDADLGDHVRVAHAG